MQNFSIFSSFLEVKIDPKSTFFNLLEGFVSRTLLDSNFEQFWVNFERSDPQSTRHGAVETHVRPFCEEHAIRQTFYKKKPPKRLENH